MTGEIRKQFKDVLVHEFFGSWKISNVSNGQDMQPEWEVYQKINSVSGAIVNQDTLETQHSRQRDFRDNDIVGWYGSVITNIGRVEAKPTKEIDLYSLSKAELLQKFNEIIISRQRILSGQYSTGHMCVRDPDTGRIRPCKNGEEILNCLKECVTDSDEPFWEVHSDIQDDMGKNILVILCGQGEQSKRNAEFFAKAPSYIDFLLQYVTKIQNEKNDLRNLVKSL